VSSIGRLNETALHEQLKAIYADGAQTEVEVDGFVVDVLRNGEIIEIQTGNFNAFKRKLARLAANHRVRVVHPVPATTMIVRTDGNGAVVSRRRSPKRGTVVDAFRQITRIAELLPNPQITVEVVLVEVVEERIDDGRGSWRRRGVTISGRRLERVTGSRELTTATDYLSMLPEDLADPFTNADVASLAGLKYRTIQPLTSALRKMGLITITEKRGQTLVYERAHVGAVRKR
jgi:hypothetical protein